MTNHFRLSSVFSELTQMQDIESFFNDNFFKKIQPTISGQLSDEAESRMAKPSVSDDFMGVPQSFYEPNFNYQQVCFYCHFLKVQDHGKTFK